LLRNIGRRGSWWKLDGDKMWGRIKIALESGKGKVSRKNDNGGMSRGSDKLFDMRV
jgi:hypothetical protein